MPEPNTPIHAPDCQPFRHPELVSGSIPPSAQTSQFERWMLKQVQHDENSSFGDRLKAQTDSEIMPVGIVAFDEVDLPLTVPALQLLLSRNGRVHGAEQFVSHEAMDGVSAGKSLNFTVAMLPKSCDEIAGYTDVKSAVRFAREDVDTRVPLHRHKTERADKWILKQVQDDAMDGSS